MRNIPTDLLRAFITVIDLKGFTRAGERLGRTQPTISLQIKKLQELVGVPLIEKEGAGSKLTEAGELVASYARRILALNDEMIMKLARRDAKGRLRIGIPNDYADHFMSRVIASFSSEYDGMSFDVECDLSVNLLRDFREGLFDIAIAMTIDGPAEGAHMTWRERLTWIANPEIALPVPEPVRIVCYPEGCLYRRSMITALQREGRSFDLVYTSPSLSGVEAALAAGFGVSVLAERTVPERLARLGPQYGLPQLPEMVVGIYVRSGPRMREAQTLAARFSEVLAHPVARVG